MSEENKFNLIYMDKVFRFGESTLTIVEPAKTLLLLSSCWFHKGIYQPEHLFIK
jgi:hypothetical protein